MSKAVATVQAVEIKTIIVKVKEHELKLSVEDARKLLTALGDLLGREVVKETRVVHDKEYVTVPQPYPVDPNPDRPYWPWRETTWCKNNTFTAQLSASKHTATLSVLDR